jgi:hypothetical protein
MSGIDGSMLDGRGKIPDKRLRKRSLGVEDDRWGDDGEREDDLPIRGGSKLPSFIELGLLELLLLLFAKAVFASEVRDTSVV